MTPSVTGLPSPVNSRFLYSRGTSYQPPDFLLTPNRFTVDPNLTIIVKVKGFFSPNTRSTPGKKKPPNPSSTILFIDLEIYKHLIYPFTRKVSFIWNYCLSVVCPRREGTLVLFLLPWSTTSQKVKKDLFYRHGRRVFTHEDEKPMFPILLVNIYISDLFNERTYNKMCIRGWIQDF